MKIDATDLRVLGILKQNAKLSMREISKIVRKPITTVHNRVKKLQNEKVIKKYTVEIDNKKINREIDAFVLINISYDDLKESGKNQEQVANEIKKLDDVEEVCIITGMNDIVIRVKKRTIDDLNKFLVDKLRKISGVAKTQTAIILKEIH
ncbi:Lrp/AsnC family transcriptional regulator [Candidatus Pacearchaeota archaeon]|nr:Lrp/AsnC family transcriptional regulator [Candidatus Pacearchaeota archaeon]